MVIVFIGGNHFVDHPQKQNGSDKVDDVLAVLD